MEAWTFLPFLISVTRWINCLFNFWSFSVITICTITFKIKQSKFKILPNTKWTLSKWPKWWNFSKSGYTDLDHFWLFPSSGSGTFRSYDWNVSKRATIVPWPQFLMWWKKDVPFRAFDKYEHIQVVLPTAPWPLP